MTGYDHRLYRDGAGGPRAIARRRARRRKRACVDRRPVIGSPPMFTGVITAIVTPFRGGVLDEDALRRLVGEQIAAGIDGLVPVGTTGESPTLSFEEHIRVIKVVVEETRKRVPIIAGAGANSTREAIELSRAAKEVGADGLL